MYFILGVLRPPFRLRGGGRIAGSWRLGLAVQGAGPAGVASVVLLGGGSGWLALMRVIMMRMRMMTDDDVMRGWGVGMGAESVDGVCVCGLCA